MIGEAKNGSPVAAPQEPNKLKQTSARVVLQKARSANSCQSIKRVAEPVAKESWDRPVKNMVCSYTMENMQRRQFYSDKDCQRLRDLLAVPTPPFSSSLLPPKIPALNPERLLSPEQLVRLEAINRDKHRYEEKRSEERKAQDLLATQQLRAVLFKREEIRAIMKKNQAFLRSKLEASQAAKSTAAADLEDLPVSPKKQTADQRAFGLRTTSLPGSKQQLVSAAKSDKERKQPPVFKSLVGDFASTDLPAVRMRVQSTTSILQKSQPLQPQCSMKSLRSAPISRTGSNQKLRIQLSATEHKRSFKPGCTGTTANRNAKETTTDITQTSYKKPKDFELIEESFDNNYIVQLRPRGIGSGLHPPL